MKHLKAVNGVSIAQAAELLEVPSAKILQLVGNGSLESISFGGGGVDGITYESVKNCIRLQAEKDLFQRKTIDKARKSWGIFADFFLDEGEGVKLSRLYEIYEKWTRREGLMTLSKVELGDFLIDIQGMGESWENSERMVAGIALKPAAEKMEHQDESFLKQVFSVMDRLGEISGEFRDVAKLLKVSPRTLRTRIEKIRPILERDRFSVTYRGHATNTSKDAVKILKVAD